MNPRVTLPKEQRKGTAGMMLAAVGEALDTPRQQPDEFTRRLSKDGITCAVFTNTQDGYAMFRLLKGTACIEYTELSGEIFFVGRVPKELAALLVHALARLAAFGLRE
jgi:hypothetical protein